MWCQIDREAFRKYCGDFVNPCQSFSLKEGCFDTQSESVSLYFSSIPFCYILSRYLGLGLPALPLPSLINSDLLGTST